MTNELLDTLMAAAGPATDMALMGQRDGAIALLVGQGADAAFAARFLDGMLAMIADGIATAAKAARDLETAERIAYNVGVLVSEGMSIDAARTRAGAWA